VVATLGAAAGLLALAPPAALAVPAGLEAALKEIAVNESAKYNCSYSIAFRDAKGTAVAAAGFVDAQKKKEASTTDEYAFGSVTKVLTGASIMKLASEGHLSLDSLVALLVDPIIGRMADRDPQQGFRSLGELWGEKNVSSLTVRQLLSMRSGVPDFDTATPCMQGQTGCVPTDPLRKDLYEHPQSGYSPMRLMEVDWVKNSWKGECKSKLPFMGAFCYSSTNFMLLGLILLAHQQGSNKSWTDLDQKVFLPDYLKDKLQFANVGTPSNYTDVHGFDRTSYNMPKDEHADHDNIDVAGVFSGWTASDIVASAASVADLTWEVYGPPSSIAPKEFVEKMIPTKLDIYGLATFNLNRMTGQSGKYGVAYGHLGATYGYQSVTAYFPSLEFAVTVATNIERDYQEQPADAMCFVFNKAAGLLLNKTISCTYGSGGYYSGGCKCDPIEEEIVIV